jgi:hypothetical protein
VNVVEFQSDRTCFAAVPDDDTMVPKMEGEVGRSRQGRHLPSTSWRR